jgi:mercuric ion transport protein
MIEGRAETGALATSGVAAILASACCVGPLVLVATGLGGAWVGYLTVFEPYRWIFIGLAVAALVFAWRRIFRPAAQCNPGEACAVPQARRVFKIAIWFVAALVAIAAALPYMADVLVGG